MLLLDVKYRIDIMSYFAIICGIRAIPTKGRNNKSSKDRL